MCCVPLQEVEEDENEEEAEDDVAEDALAQGAAKKAGAAAAKKKKAAKGAWVGAVARTEDGDKFYSKAKVGRRYRRCMLQYRQRGQCMQ